MKTVVLIGASLGIGGAVATYLSGKGVGVISVSLSQAAAGKWVQSDVSTEEGIQKVLDHVGEQELKGFLFLGGIWEEGAFTEDYDFLNSPQQETRQLIAVNLTAPILLAQGLASNLAMSEAGRIILMGSMSGLQNTATQEVANTATKFGVQGVCESLNLALRHLNISATVINPDYVATPEVQDEIDSGQLGVQEPIPMDDINKTIDYVLNLSQASVPTVINLQQTRPVS